MHLCQESNQASDVTADAVATRYLISLELARSLLKPGPIPDVDGVSLHGNVHVAQLICDVLADPRGASSVLRAEVMGPGVIQIATKRPVKPGFVQQWNNRAAELGIEINWPWVEFAMSDVTSLVDRLESGLGGPALQIDSTTVNTSGVEFIVNASAADVDTWRRNDDWPAWAELFVSAATP